MKRFPVLIVLLAAVAGYFGYRWFASRPPEVWKYIPDTASVIISSDQLQEVFGPVADTLPAQYADLPLISLAKGALSVVRWFNEDQEQVSRFLREKTITYAFHPLAGNRLGIVMYLPVRNEIEEKWLGNLKTGTVRVSSHHFQGNAITDISSHRSEPLFSYILKNGYLIVSQYGELIEDIIRLSGSGGSDRSRLSEKFTPLPEGQHKLSIYASGKDWRGFMLPAATDAGVSAFLDLIPGQSGFHLEQEYTASRLAFRSDKARASENAYRSLVADQDGAPFTGAAHISQRTTHMIRLAVKNGSKFHTAYRKWLRDRRSLPSLAQLDRVAGKEKEAFLDEIGPEMILCTGEGGLVAGGNKVALVQYGDFEKTRTFFDALAGKAGPGVFLGYEIYPVAIPGLAEGLFGPVFAGFSESHFTYAEPYLVIGNNAQAVRNYLIDLENRFTWNSSRELDSLGYFEKNNAQLLLVTNMEKARAGTEGRRTSLKSSLDEIATTVVAYEASGKYAEIGVEINYSKAHRTQTGLLADLEWTGAFPTVFSAMNGPAGDDAEILLTNDRNELIRIPGDPAGTPSVLARLDGPPGSRAYSADFLNIGRSQRVIASSGTLYVIDEDDSGLITVLPAQAPAPVSAMYRVNDASENGAGFIIRSSDQRLYLWTGALRPPVRLSASLPFENPLAPVVSFPGADASNYVVTQRNGKVFLFDGKGSVVPGFPVDMLSGVGGAFSTVQNRESGEMELCGVNLQGELARISRTGNILERRQLLLPEGGCSFRTLHDENSLDWLFVRQTQSKAAILDKDGREIFEIVSLKRDFSIRYHYFGSDNRFISVLSGGFISVFDLRGNRIGDTPIPCDGASALTYRESDGVLTIFSQSKGKIGIWAARRM